MKTQSTKGNYMTFKRGANKSDIKRIKQMFSDGLASSEISKILFIEASVIESFAPKKPKAKKPKAKKPKAED